MAVIAFAAAALTLTGCAASGAKTYGSIEELVSDYEAAGFYCDWDRTDQVTAALESGTCSDQSVLSIYNDASEANESAESLAETLRGFGMEPTILVGPNWVINDSDVVGLQRSLGGRAIAK